MTVDIDHLRSWIGRTDRLVDSATIAPLRGLAATLDHEDTSPILGALVPPAWHWLYFLPFVRQSDIGSDGHPNRGGFLPPVPLPRRMWAGSHIQFIQPLRVGQRLERLSRIEDVRLKDGRTGPLVFVKIKHEILGDEALSIVEEQDIVYRDLPNPSDTPPAPLSVSLEPQWERLVVPDDVMLFRYSALTFNGHRIHYDRKYTTEVEGYPGLVVQGPLIATSLLDLVRRQFPNAQVKTFQFRALSPLFDHASFRVCGRLENAETVKLWACNEKGHLAMDATATCTDLSL